MYDENSLTGHRTVVDELRRQVERSHATWDPLDKKSTTLFQSAGVLITLAGFIKLAILQQRLAALVGPSYPLRLDRLRRPIHFALPGSRTSPVPWHRPYYLAGTE